MNDIVVRFDEREQMELANEIQRVFTLLDIPLGKEKKAIFVSELSTAGLPLGAILAGLNSLLKEDATAIKISTVLGASRRHLEPEFHGGNCNDCHGGFVVMKDDQGRRFSLACRCPSGHQKQMANHIATWNGEATMFRAGRLLTRIEPIPMGGNDDNVPF